SVSTGDTAFTSSSDVNLSTSTFGGATTSNVFSGLTPNTVYYFNLFAYDTWGFSTSSANELSTTTLAAIPLSLASSGITHTEATLSWQTNTNPAGTGYYVENTGNTTMNSGWITNTSYGFGSLSCGSSYSFHVKARNSAGLETNWSSPSGVSTSACTVATPPQVAPPPPPLELTPVELKLDLETCPVGTTNPACIKPEVNQPTGLISITNGTTVLQFTNSGTVTLKLDERYADKIALKESDGSPSQNFDGASFESISAGKSWTLSGADGKKCINARFFNSEKGYTYTTYACVTLDTIKPLAPTISLADSGVVHGKIVNKPSLGGTTSEPYLNIIISKTAIGKLALSAATTFYTTSNAEGDWNYNFATYLDPGSYELAVKAEDQAGNSSETTQTELTIPDGETQVEEPIEEEAIEEEEKEDLPIEIVQDQAPPDSGNTQSDVSDTSSDNNSSTDSPSNIVDNIEVEELTQKDLLIESTQVTSTQETNAVISASVEGVKTVAKNIRENLAPIAQHIEKVINNPQVEYTNETTVAPTIVVASAANALTGFGLSQVLVYLRFLFTQPFLLLRMRRRRHWGVVYNSFTKQPIDLAIIRLIDANTHKIHETQVTDTKGRYLFVSDPGDYRLEVSKQGFGGLSVHLKDRLKDNSYTNLYHGETITIGGERNAVIYNIPLDPDGVIVPTKKLLKQHTRKILQTSLSSISVFVALISFVISPTLLIAMFLLVHILIYIIFHYLSTQGLGKDFGTIFHQKKNKVLKNTIIRIFDATYNRLVDTKISNTKGRYAALVGSGNYIVTYEKPSFEIKKTEVSISAREKMGGVIARDERLTKTNSD
ncbi:MAG: hypothetical protein HYV41_01970, partial [Candidatus Magasanikbacteria bacterium]|nr:hypothetical protein [Candidatus Magasanikbacteria bacterium]